MKPVLKKTQAIVLRYLDYQDSDRIVTLLTPDCGRVSAIAKNARKSRKRFTNALDLFACIQILYRERAHSELVSLQSAQLIQSFGDISRSLDRIAAASYMVEAVRECTLQNQDSGDLFQLLHQLLESLCQTADPAISRDYARIFEIRLLKFIGLQPDFTHCLQCRKTLDESRGAHFSQRQGGVHCPGCRGAAGSLVTLSAGSLKLLRSVLNAPLPQVLRFRMSAQTRRECGAVLPDFLEYQMGKRLKSRAFLESV